MSEPVEARRYTVHGRVQGVGFRYWTQRMATQRGIVGWVRNRSDGTVELQAQGDPGSLDDLERLLRQGPPAGSVSRLVSTDASVTPSTEFRVVPTI